MCNFAAHSLCVASESDKCKEQLKDLEIKEYRMCAPKLNILTNWDSGTVYVE